MPARGITKPDLAQFALALAAMCALVRGQPAGGWIGTVIGLHAVLLAVLPHYRRRTIKRWRSAWQAAMEYPLVRRSIPWPAVLLLVVVPDTLFLLLRDRGIQSGDSRPVVMTAASLVCEGDAELTEFVPVYVRHHLFTSSDAPPYFFLPSGEGIYSHYPSGMVPFALPVVAAAHLAGCDLNDPTVHERLEKLTAACVSAACVGLFFLLALHLVAPRPAYVATILLATGSVMFSTVGQALWQHGGVLFWLELLLLVEFRSFAAPTWQSVALEGCCCGMMLACRLSAGLVVAAFGVWLLVRSARRAMLVATIGAAAALPWALVNLSTYGSPLGPMAVQAQGTFWSFTDLDAWAGILFSPTHGLLVYQPWIWLVPLAALFVSAPMTAVRDRLCRERPPWRSAEYQSTSFPTLGTPQRAFPTERNSTYGISDGRVGAASFSSKSATCRRAALPAAWQAWAAAVIVLHLALISGWKCWWGGWCWGSRLAAEIVPLAALLTLGPLAALLASRTGRRIVYGLVLASALLHVPSVYLQQARWYAGVDSEHETAALWRWASPPFLFPLRR